MVSDSIYRELGGLYMTATNRFRVARSLILIGPKSLANLAVQGTGRPMTATNRFKVAKSLILNGPKSPANLAVQGTASG